MKQFLLTQGYFTILDDEDYDKFKDLNWQIAKPNPNAYYAQTIIVGIPVLLHKLIMNADTLQYIDHINGNGLDNRKENLRFATASTNQANRRVHKKIGKHSIYKGVSFDKTAKNKPWIAMIMKNRKSYHLGRFFTEKEAACAYDKKSVELFGEYAYLNFPKENNS